MKYERLIELNKTDSADCYVDEIARMQKTMKLAQKQWDKNFGKNLCEKLTEYMSPKRKKNDNEPSDRKKRMKIC